MNTSYLYLPLLVLFFLNSVAIAAPGTLKWKYELNTQANSMQVLSPDQTSVYVAEGDTLRSIDTVSGTRQWSFQAADNIMHPSVNSNGDIFFQAGTSGVYALDRSGNSLWATPYNPQGNWQADGADHLAIHQDGSIYARQDGALYAINPDGSPKWVTYKVGEVPAIASNDILYAIGIGNVLNKIDAFDGSILDVSSVGHGAHRQPPSIGLDGDIYVYSSFGVTAIKQDLSLSWRSQIGGSILGQATTDVDGTVYFIGDRSNFLYAINSDGSPKWTLEITDIILWGTPTVGDNGIVYVGSDKGVVAVDTTSVLSNPEDSILWTFTPNTSVRFSSAAGTLIMSDDGTIYIYGNEGDEVINFKTYLYAINSSSTGPANSTWPMFGADAQQTFSFSRGSEDFSFSRIGEQKVNVPFEITITARDQYRNIDTSFNDSVALSSAGVISPVSVELVNGTATFTVTLFDQGHMRLHASMGERSGYSNLFNVTGSGGCAPRVGGDVVDLMGDPVMSPDVTFTNSKGESYTVTPKSDHYEKVLACDSYTVVAKKGEVQSVTTNLSVTKNTPYFLNDIILPINDGEEPIPVVLVPGILGSSQGSRSPYPKLPREMPAPPDWLHLHDPTDKPGWKKFKETLREAKFNTFDCPWDWRLPFDRAYREYLIPCIDKAKKLSGLGEDDKVHVVAHSMGGLVTRAYIQGSKYRNDIAKFVMAGTPNLGSTDAYYIWEGGDPKLIDDIKDSGATSSVNFYSNTIQNLWEEAYGKKGWDNGDPEAIRTFVHDVGPSLRQLMSTEKRLINKSGETRIVSTLGNRNDDLESLNSDPDISRMTKENDSNKVQVGLIVGTLENTITAIEVGDLQPTLSLYQDGRPVDNPKKTVIMELLGDGTVPQISASWPEYEGWAEGSVSFHTKHNELIKKNTEVIKTFLQGGSFTATAATLQGSSSSVSRTFSVTQTTTPQLSFSLSGGARVSVTDPGGNKFGHDPATGELLEEVPLSEIIFGNDGGSLATEIVTNGTYTVTLFGIENRDFFIDVGYVSEETTESVDLHGFFSGQQIRFEVIVNSVSTPHLTITLPAQMPDNLLANPSGTVGNGLTVLSWDESQESGVTHYHIYAAGELNAFFTLTDTVAHGTTTYTTADPWAKDTTKPVKTYYVTAVKSDGSESFFGKAARNDDRDHDGATDVDEDAIGTDPDKLDTDGDGLSDGEERNYGTDPLKKDTDGDGFSDSEEILAGTDPLDKTAFPQTAKKKKICLPIEDKNGNVAMVCF